MVLERRFIESVRFPFREISEASAVEKGPDRPPHWRMVFWWTRKPLISARAVIAGCLLRENTNPNNFLKSIGIGVGSAHRVKPKLRFDGVKLLDPFACFGSIPHEAVRLGLSATACDLLPVGYVFLKTVLEYPVKYGRKLVEDVKKWGEWVTEKLREDSLIKELYDDDIAVYIGSWEIKCPSCGKWTPLIGNWWLAKEGGKRGYKRLAWMEPKIEGNSVKINVVDLNKTLGKEVVREAKVEGTRVKVKGKECRVPERNVQAKRQLAICLQCNQPIKHIDPETGKHYTETKNLPRALKKRLTWYVKFALSLYNQAIEVNEILVIPSWIKEVPARLRLLVKVKQKEFEFEPCLEGDQEKLKRAKQEVERLLEQNDPDIAREPIPRYEVRRITPILGAHKWFQFFNPRQLLVLIKLTKLIREVGKLIEGEKVKEGLNREDAFEHAEAVTAWLAVALARYVSYNSILTVWNYGVAKLSAHVAHTISMRGIAMMWNCGDVAPFADVTGTGSWSKNLDSTARQSLAYLTDALQGSSKDFISIILDDATILSKFDPDEKFDLIITDPPYYDDVPYAELSDFYYVWLKRALSDADDGRLKPRFLSEAFFEKVSGTWIEVSTQWEKYALSEVSLNPSRLGSNATTHNGVRHFQNLLSSSFSTMASKLENDGLLVTYYAHTNPDAWKALLEAGWDVVGLRVTNAFPIATESALSIVSRGKLSMDTSIIVIWRKGSEGSIEASSLYNQMVEEASKRSRELIELGAVGRDFVIGTLAAALAVATRYKEVKVMGRVNVGTLVDQYVYPAAYLGMAKAYAQKAEIKDGVKSPDAMFYLLVKSTLAGAKEKILESTDARIFSIGTSLDLNLALRQKILRPRKKEGGAQVAKAKTLALVEPTSTDRSKLAELLEARGIGTKEPKIKCTIDALHVLQYFAITYSREEFRRRLEEMRAKYPAFVEEALSMARILAKVLPERDVEKNLCNRILEHLRPITPKLA